MTVPLKPTLERTKEGVVVLDYEKLIQTGIDYTQAIEVAYGNGPDCLGVLVVKNVPTLREKRLKLLHLASHLGNLAPSALQKIKDPVTEWVGWDHGTEVFHGKADLAKGSFYANPLYDIPETNPDVIREFPGMTRPNLWPSEDLPDLEGAFKDLAQLILQIGSFVAQQCDQYAVSRNIPTYPSKNHLASILANSRTHKGRLLHYFPQNTLAAEQLDSKSLDNLCGWHFDNSCITGLTSALYVRESRDENQALRLEPVPAPEDAGLFIRTRGGDVKKVSIPSDCIAFQIGEALEMSTQGQLRATEHCVFGGSDKSVARNTLAIFCQPNLFDPITPTQTFAEFSKAIYYKNH